MAGGKSEPYFARGRWAFRKEPLTLGEEGGRKGACPCRTVVMTGDWDS